jgi:hypothetical protein
MRRLVYGSPASDEPSGGVKVFHRHVEVLRAMGHEAAIWHPGSVGFRCSWFEHEAPVVETPDLHPANDFIVLPEIWATGYVPMLKSQGFKVGIFVQNAYLTHVNFNTGNPNGIRDAYADADLVLSISSDSSRYLEEIHGVPAGKIQPQRYTVDRRLFHPAEKARLITFMPRKLADHGARVVSALRPLLPAGWEIVPLDNLAERQVAFALSKSAIFLAFSEFEGLPVPPVEAALAGNVVIGYHGQGGREYWHAPNFIEVDQGDFQQFVFEVRETLIEIGSGQLNVEALNAGIDRLAAAFSPATERELLEALVSRVRALDAGPSAQVIWSGQ